MKYGIVENSQFVLIDDDLQRLKQTLLFMPHLSANQIAHYENSEVEQGYDGNWYEKGHAPQKPLEEARAAKLAEINGVCDGILKAAIKTYPDTEVMTFDQQVSEARACVADPTSETPLLASLASARGIGLAELAGRVLAKHQAYSALSGAVIGQRQALEDQLEACTTVEAVNALTVNIVVPTKQGEANEQTS